MPRTAPVKCVKQNVLSIEHVCLNEHAISGISTRGQNAFISSLNTTNFNGIKMHSALASSEKPWKKQQQHVQNLYLSSTTSTRFAHILGRSPDKSNKFKLSVIIPFLGTNVLAPVNKQKRGIDILAKVCRNQLFLVGVLCYTIPCFLFLHVFHPCLFWKI